MAQDKRKFSGSISVRIDTKRQKLELSPAFLHGGPEGFYRVRLDRRWLDTEDGSPRFYDQEGLARLAAATLFSSLEKPAPAPDLPYPSRVTARLWVDDMPYAIGTYTKTPPILSYEGIWVVAIVDHRGKTVFVPCEDVTVRENRRHRRG